MLSPITLTAIAVLVDIHSKGTSCRMEQHASHLEILPELLLKLESTKLIRRIEGTEAGAISSYELTKEFYTLSLLEILQATGEHLDCNQPISEELYNRYSVAAKKLGIINHITQFYLKDIMLSDL